MSGFGWCPSSEKEKADLAELAIGLGLVSTVPYNPRPCDCIAGCRHCRNASAQIIPTVQAAPPPTAAPPPFKPSPWYYYPPLQ